MLENGYKLKICYGIMLSAILTFTGCKAVKPFASSEPVFLTKSEVQALFTGQTVESRNLTRITSFTYYHPNGKALQERLWERRTGKWRVLKDGKICLQFSGKKERCRIIGKKDGRYRKYRPDKSGQLVPVVKYRRFIDGNVLKL